MTGAGLAQFFRFNVRLASGFSGYRWLGWHVSHRLRSLVPWMAGRWSYQPPAALPVEKSRTAKTEYLSLVAMAEDLEQALKTLNSEIADLEGRIRKLAQF